MLHKIKQICEKAQDWSWVKNIINIAFSTMNIWIILINININKHEDSIYYFMSHFCCFYAVFWHCMVFYASAMYLKVSD